MVTIDAVEILRGYTGYDHLITAAATAAVRGTIGRRYRDAAAAARAVRRAYQAAADPRVARAPLSLLLLTPSGVSRRIRV